MPAPDQPVSFQTKEEHVAEYLREGIISGSFPRGTRLKQDDIADALQISITPVRGAFRLLEAEGYLVSERHRGVIVAPFDAQTTSEITDLRILLECRLVSAATRRMTPDHLAGLRELHHRLEQAVRQQDRARVRAMNYRFHSYLYGIAELPQTLHFVQVLWAKYPFDLIHMVQGRPLRVLKEHAALLKALASGKPSAAAQAARTHIESGWRDLAGELARTGPETQAPRPVSGGRKPTDAAI
jgi:DNA-binding GntR family transcriptional regulator